MADCEILKPFVLSWEGGFANVAGDRGGATNKGVTLATYRQMYGSGKTVEDLKRMTDGEWMTVFRRGFWDRWQGDRIVSQAVANMVVDWLWMSGAYGVKIPQRVLGVTVDGIVGEKTLEALNGADAAALFERLKEERRAYFERIVKSNPTQKKFLQGWLNRLNGMYYDRLVCAGGKVVKC